MLGSVPPGHVAVYQTNDRTSAHLGELSVTSLASRGCAGAVIDGGARDAEYILREDFPVFARYVTPQDCVPRWELLAHGDVTIVVGGVRIAPGDWIVGRPRRARRRAGRRRSRRSSAEAEEKVATESEIRESVRRGRSRSRPTSASAPSERPQRLDNRRAPAYVLQTIAVARREAVSTGHLRIAGGLCAVALALGAAACGSGGSTSSVDDVRRRREAGLRRQAAHDRHLALALGRLLRPGQGGDARLPALGRRRSTPRAACSVAR